MKFATAIFIFASSLVGVYRYAYLPYRCSVVHKTVELSTEQAFRRSDWSSAAIARNNLKLLDECPRDSRTDTHTMMLRAINLRLLNRTAEAAQQYEELLSIERSPEIHLNLGLTRLQRGERQRALASLLRAARVDPTIIRTIQDPNMLDQIHFVLQDHYISAGNLLRNGSFLGAGIHGEKSHLAEARVQLGAAASNWDLRVFDEGMVSTEILPSTRSGRGERMLRVKVAGRNGGIEQAWSSRDVGPAHVITSAWVYVISGKVKVGAGNGRQAHRDVESTSTGRWELLTAKNRSCPANAVGIYAATPSAEFYVDWVEVRAIRGPRCEQR